MTDSVSLTICGDVERSARLALVQLSVKSVDRIEVIQEPQRATAETIALARLQ
jgi:hypothetical protein